MRGCRVTHRTSVYIILHIFSQEETSGCDIRGARGQDIDPHLISVAYPGFLVGGGGVQQIQTEDRENGDLGAVAP